MATVRSQCSSLVLQIGIIWPVQGEADDGGEKKKNPNPNLFIYFLSFQEWDSIHGVTTSSPK